MIEIQDGNASLTRVEHRSISKPANPLTIGELELRLIARFPREDAEEWDRMGLLVGDPAKLVTGVAVALDPTAEAVRAARDAKANVLLTHHPVFLGPPESFSPSYDVASAPGVTVWNAIASDVALINLHTALDVSAEARGMFCEMLSVDYERTLVRTGDDPGKGYGLLCRIRPSEGSFKLSHLAARCTSVFGRPPRVWGDTARSVRSIAFANGSANSVIASCRASGADCVVCGELGYHAALDATQAGLAVIELGHDASELPLTAVLAQAAIDAGIPADRVSVIDQSANWVSQDSRRI